jgi:hypothetical protein
VTRLAREDGVRVRVFQDEELALEYLQPPADKSRS